MSDAPLLFETADGIAWLTLNRPDVLNAINMAARDELWSALLAVRDDPDVRVAVIRGAGERAFSAGADISEFGTAPSYAEARRARRERDVWGLMLSIMKPLVASVHGFAYGAGCELPLLCDIRITSDDARFALPEVTLGYIPSAGGTQTLPRTVPAGVAREMILTGEPIDAQRALSIGLVNRVVPRARLGEETAAIAARLAALPPAAVAAVKEALIRGSALPLEQGLRLEALLAELLRRPSGGA
ncbi:MAG TPA: enoyl-CoA hydratase/isomerase family protein [Steroidobacteraceae bacterium]|nr:enoyl-CoA hydratase/isomerase family protein [Steroidobacteraceae bacterium]